MDNYQSSGFSEISHTADWALRVWAPDLPSLLTISAQGMYSLMGVVLNNGPRMIRYFKNQYEDDESLLVGFLNELIFLMEKEHLVFDQIKIRIEGETITSKMEGVPIRLFSKAIKAVTYHNLNIIRTVHGLETTIVFDV